MHSIPEHLALSLEIINKDTELDQFFPHAYFIHETARQIIKDFSEFDIDIRFSGNTNQAYEELFRQMEFEIANILDRDFHKLLNLLYRIDVSEKDILHPETGNPDSPISGLLTDIIIRRELKKVLLRFYFKHIDPKQDS